MGLMPLRIKASFHADQPSVYSILVTLTSTTFSAPQEENDPTFPIAL